MSGEMLDWDNLLRDVDAAREAQVPVLNVAIHVVKAMAESNDVERFLSLPLDVRTEVGLIIAALVEKGKCVITSNEGLEDLSVEVRKIADLLR